ncbi:conjugal transfer protein TraG N-terminal domain-containing protein [Acidovorax sp. LjRoot129]
MAMFFGQDDWVASAIKTGLMLSLIFILAQGVTRNGLRLDVMVIQVIVVWAMFMPKTTVTVEQFDNAAPPRVVDDVPYAIALPASVAGAFALYMTSKIEAVMVNVDGDYLSVSGDSHPFTPARALMAITMCPSDPMSCADQNLVESMRLASRYCASGKLANTDFKVSGNVLQSFADTLELQGQTIVFDTTNPYIPGGGGGRAVSCADAASHFLSVAQNERDGVGSVSKAMNGLANRAEIKKYSSSARAASQTERTWDEALTDINRLRDSNSKMDSLAFANVTLYALADTMKFSANAPLDQAISIRRDTSLFEWAKSESQQSMLVSTTAPKFMDILFFVFIASTPIVMFIVAANPQGGLKVAGSYALFGMWTQSWIPMMAIVMSWYQTEIRNMVSPQSFTPEYMAFFMRHAYTTTIAASNMIQQAPYLMFAIMTGSMFALSGMVSKAMPSGKGDSSAALKGGGAGGGGADVMNPGSAKGAIPGAGMGHALHGGMAAMQGGMTSAGVGVSGDGSAALPGIAKLSGSGAVQGGTAQAMESSASSRQQLQSQSQQAFSELAQLVQSSAKKIGGAKTAQAMSSSDLSFSFDSKTGQISSKYGSFDVSSGQTNSTGTQASAGVEANASGGFKVFGNGLNVGANIAGAIKEAVSQDVKAGNSNGARQQQDAGTSESTRVSGGRSASSGSSSTDGAEYGNAATKADALQKTFSKLASQTDALDKADKATSQASQTSAASVGKDIDGGSVVSNWAAQSSRQFNGSTGNDGVALSRVQGIANSALSSDQQKALGESAAAEMKRLDKTGASTALGRDQVAMAAAWNTLSDMAATASTPQEKIAAQLGMAQLAKAAGSADITKPLQAVKDSLDAVAGVASNISAMESKISPSVAQSVAAADSRLSASATGGFNSSVAQRMDEHKKEANGARGAALGGLSAVTAAGEAAKTQALNSSNSIQSNLTNTAPLVKASQESSAAQSAIPMSGDINQFGAGNQTSVGHKIFGSQSEGKNSGANGPEGSNGVAPTKTLNDMLGSGATKAQELSSDLSHSLAKVSSVAPAALGSAVSASMDTARSLIPGGGQSGGSTGSTSSSTTNIISGGSASELPKLGGDGGINLSQGGGGSGPAPASAPVTPSAKPYAKDNPSTDAGKSKTPMGRR